MNAEIRCINKLKVEVSALVDDTLSDERNLVVKDILSLLDDAEVDALARYEATKPVAEVSE